MRSTIDKNGNIVRQNAHAERLEQKILGAYIDQEQNIIGLVINDNRTVDVYQKTANSPLVRIETPQSPYILFDPYMQEFSVFIMDKEAHLYELRLNGSTDHYQPGNILNIHRVIRTFPNKEQILCLFKQKKWAIPENIPTDAALKDLIFPPEPVNNVLDDPAAPVLQPNIRVYAQEAIDTVQSNLPQEIKEELQRVFMNNTTDYLTHENALNEIDMLLNLRVNNGNAFLNINQLSEHWLSYRFIVYPDLRVADCQSYLLNLFIALANRYRDENIDVHARPTSERTILEFLMKDYPARPVNPDEQYIIRITGLQAAQYQNIDNFLDYPQGFEKHDLKQLLNTMIDAHGIQHPEPQAVINAPILYEDGVPAIPPEMANFCNTCTSIKDYWQVPVYMDFLAFLWNMCDAVMRFLTYMDIYALRLTETGQLISSFESLGDELQENICVNLRINEDFTTHIANHVWG